DGDLADQPAVAEERRLADRLHAEGAWLEARPDPAGAERLGKRWLAIRVPDRRPDPLGPRVREPDSLGVGNYYKRRPCVLHGRHRHLLNDAARADAARVTRDDRLLQAGLRGEALRHGQGTLLVLLVELPVQVPLHDGKAGGH